MVSLANQLDEIYPNLWLGDITAAESIDVLEAHAITDIISITSHRPKIPKGLNIRKKHFRLRDSTAENLLLILPECISLLESILNENDEGTGPQRRVLVHCRMGVSRSGGIVVAYVMKYAQIQASLALDYVRSMRRIVNPNRAFMAQLTVWGECGYDTALLVHAGGDMAEDPGMVEAEDEDEELLQKALEISLLPEYLCDKGTDGDTNMDWAGMEVKADVLRVRQTGEEQRSEDHEGSRDTEMGEEFPPLQSDGDKETEIPQERDTLQNQAIPSHDTAGPIVPRNLLIPHNKTTSPHPLNQGLSKESITPMNLECLYPEQRRRDKGKEVDQAVGVEDPVPSQGSGWAEIIMEERMQKCFEECMRDIDKEFGLGWVVATLT